MADISLGPSVPNTPYHRPASSAVAGVADVHVGLDQGHDAGLHDHPDPATPAPFYASLSTSQGPSFSLEAPSSVETSPAPQPSPTNTETDADATGAVRVSPPNTLPLDEVEADASSTQDQPVRQVRAVLSAPCGLLAQR